MNFYVRLFNIIHYIQANPTNNPAGYNKNTLETNSTVPDSEEVAIFYKEMIDGLSKGFNEGVNKFTKDSHYSREYDWDQSSPNTIKSALKKGIDLAFRNAGLKGNGLNKKEYKVQVDVENNGRTFQFQNSGSDDKTMQ